MRWYLFRELSNPQHIQGQVMLEMDVADDTQRHNMHAIYMSTTIYLSFSIEIFFLGDFAMQTLRL
jgi:hypothetical protein